MINENKNGIHKNEIYLANKTKEDFTKYSSLTNEFAKQEEVNKNQKKNFEDEQNANNNKIIKDLEKLRGNITKSTNMLIEKINVIKSKSDEN